MPITKSAKKALRQSQRRRIVNLRVKRAYKQAVKDFKASQEKEVQEKLLKTTYSQIDKAQKKGVLHKNKAARLKSKLALKSA